MLEILTNIFAGIFALAALTLVVSMVLLAIKSKNYKILFTSWEIFKVAKNPKPEWLPYLKVIKYSAITLITSFVLFGGIIFILSTNIE